MDFSLTEEQTMFRDLFREFAEKEIAKVAEHADRNEEPPLEMFKKAAAQGFFGAPIPEAYGGVGIDWQSYIAGRRIGQAVPRRPSPSPFTQSLGHVNSRRCGRAKARNTCRRWPPEK